MEKTSTPTYAPQSLFQSDSFPESFTVINIEPDCPTISYNQLLKTPSILQIAKNRTHAWYNVRFSTDEGGKKFERSTFGVLLRKKSPSQMDPSPPGFVEYHIDKGRKISQFLKEVANFGPMEVVIGQPWDRKERTETNHLKKLVYTKETRNKKEVEKRKEASRVKHFRESRDTDEENVEPGPRKKLKTEDSLFIKVKVHQQLVQSQGDLFTVIHNIPALGEKILADLDYYGKLEKHVQNKIKTDIFREWQMGIRFDGISVNQIEQSLKDKKLEDKGLRQELYFEKRDELEKFEEKSKEWFSKKTEGRKIS